MIRIDLHSVDSTQDFIKAYIQRHKPEESICVTAEHQTRGRGQRSNTWYSEEGMSLTFSLYIPHIRLDARHFFRIQQWVSIRLQKSLLAYYPHIAIKWPNDIMANDKKLAGILTESQIQKGIIRHIIVGIGLNVGQSAFPAELPGAVSLYQLTGKYHSPDELLTSILDRISPDSPPDFDNSLNDTYINNLYLFGKRHRFSSAGKDFYGCITGLSSTGKLLVKDDLGNTQSFSMGEILF